MIGDGERKKGSAAGSLFQEAVQYLYAYNGALISKIHANKYNKETLFFVAFWLFKWLQSQWQLQERGLWSPPLSIGWLSQLGHLLIKP